MEEFHPTSPKALPLEAVDRVEEAHPSSPKPWPVDEVDTVEELHPTSPKALPLEAVDRVEEAHPSSPKPWPVDEVDTVEELHPTSPKALPLEAVDRVEEAHPSFPKPCPVDEVCTVKELHPTSPKACPVDEVGTVKELHPTSPKPWPVDEVKQPNPTSPKALQSATSTETVDVTPLVIIAPSPPKYDPNVLLPSLNLYVRDKAIFKSTGWLNMQLFLQPKSYLKLSPGGKFWVAIYPAFQEGRPVHSCSSMQSFCADFACWPMSLVDYIKHKRSWRSLLHRYHLCLCQPKSPLMLLQVFVHFTSVWVKELGLMS